MQLPAFITIIVIIVIIDIIIIVIIIIVIVIGFTIVIIVIIVIIVTITIIIIIIMSPKPWKTYYRVAKALAESSRDPDFNLAILGQLQGVRKPGRAQSQKGDELPAVEA